MTTRGKRPPDMNMLCDARVETKHIAELREAHRLMGRPEHVSPFSVLIAAMSNNWAPGCFEAVWAMHEYTFKTGYQTTFLEEHDRCFQPYDALGTMRNNIYMKALAEGYEFLCYVDNDVAPPPDALVRLMRRYLPVVFPLVRWPGNEWVHERLEVGRVEEGQGLAYATASVLSMVVFQTRVFFPWASTPFWSDAIGADEGFHFRRLELSGIRPFVDTDVVVDCVKPPSFPLDERKSLKRPVTYQVSQP